MVNVLLSLYNFNSDWAKGTLEKYIHSDDKVAVIPFSFSEKRIISSEDWQNAYNSKYGKYYQDVVKPFMDFGISEGNIRWLNYFDDTDEEMQQAIAESDIVFLTGGITKLAMERVMQRGLSRYIKQCKTVIGASAGAKMQCKDYYVLPDEDYTEFSYYKGLGLIQKDFYIEVHYDDTEARNDCIRRALNERTSRVYAITNSGGMVIDGDNLVLMGEVVTFDREENK